jgi:diguanylate cyclase (GGDEF)-like protein
MLVPFTSVPRRLLAGGWIAAATAGFAFFLLHTLAGAGGPGLDRFSSVWVYDALEVLAVVAVGLRAATVDTERTAWAFLAASVASWTIGDLLWEVAYAGAPPFPSWCDLFYLGFYPPAYVGLALLVRTRLAHFNRSVWLDGLMAALAVGAVGAAVLLEVVLRGSHDDVLASATNIAYPLGDIVLLALLVGVWGLAGWRPGRGWLTIGGALALTATADGTYLYESAVGTYKAGTILDALWPAALILLAVSAWLPGAVGRKVAVQHRPLAATPVLCGTIALLVLVDAYVERRNPIAVALAAATIATVIARTVLTFHENAQVTAAATTLALTDALTGLWNRRKLLADLEALFAEAVPPPRLLVLFDLNGFKTYNDNFGHPAGDLLLARLARKLADAVGPGDGCYRLGGDEFCVLAEVPGERTAGFLTSTCDALAEHGEGFSVSTAFGCTFLPEDASTPADALHVADQRLYAHKYGTLLRGGQPHRALVQALYEREPDIEDHITSVTELSLLVGRELGLEKQALEELEVAAQLHDIGKLAIPDATLQKAGPLDAHEQALIEQHTIIGQRILSASPAFSRVALVVRASHEHWDGRGYPDALAGTDIPFAARIIAVCDAYSAMTSPRPYRTVADQNVALAEIARCAGGQFDPEIALAFRRALAAAGAQSSPIAGVGRVEA